MEADETCSTNNMQSKTLSFSRSFEPCSTDLGIVREHSGSGRQGLISCQENIASLESYVSKVQMSNIDPLGFFQVD
jgi:hypothetical protein